MYYACVALIPKLNKVASEKIYMIPLHFWTLTTGWRQTQEDLDTMQHLALHLVVSGGLKNTAKRQDGI